MTEDQVLNPWLLEQISKGGAILFLGAGAAKGAFGSENQIALTGDQLKEVISDTYLQGQLKDRSLSEVAELAKNESSLVTVQETIFDLFSSLQPADFHQLIPKFKWHAIVTTNYDYIVERAYARCEKPLQKVATLVGDGDAQHQDLSDSGIVPLLKLHGCLSKINDPDLPLILSSEEYAKHRKNRERVFGMFADWARSYPIIFCGYDISDPNIQQILFNLGDTAEKRPHYGVVKPSFTDFDIRYWQGRRIIPEQKTFEQFITTIDSVIPVSSRELSMLRSKGNLPIQNKIVRGIPSDELKHYLDISLEYVREEIISKVIRPIDFYSGMGSSWSPIASNLDAYRRITDEILLENIIDVSQERAPKITLIRGHAGSGKSITLRRTAWDASKNHGALCLWLNSGALFHLELIRELYNLVEERIYLFIDDVLPYVREIERAYRTFRHENVPVTFLIGARTNEWNVLGDELDTLVNNSYELGKLDINEIKALLELLSSNSCLGYLEELSEEKRINFFKLTADRQLLVALHEALFSGDSFENIVVDEYNKIVPPDAKSLYLDVCTFHRFNVGVRAGLISRVSGFNMEYFNKELFSPLEHLVFTYEDYSSKDYAYRSRHSVIADIVFNHVLTSPDARADQIIRLVRHMNVDYQSDSAVFNKIIKGRELANLFEDPKLVKRIFDSARETAVDESYVYHQMGIYELNRFEGDAHKALELLNTAEEHARSHKAPIKHSKAMAFKKLANDSQSDSEKSQLRSESKTILQQLLRKHKSSYSFHALGQVIVDELTDILETEEDVDSEIHQVRERRIAELVRDIEKIIVDGLGMFPRDTYLLDLESRIAELLADKPRAIRSLKSAFRIDPSSGLIAKRLGKYYRLQGDYDNAVGVLKKCLENNPDSTQTHAELGITLMNLDEESNSNEIRYHLNKAFIDGDTNYRTQFWLARHEFLFGDRNRAIVLFEQLSQSKMNPGDKHEPKAIYLNQNGDPVKFNGNIKAKKENYCFIAAPKLRQEIFAHSSSFQNSNWENASINSELEFNLAFTFNGPVGVNCMLQLND